MVRVGVFRKHGKWYIDFSHDGKRYRERIGTNKRQALNALASVYLPENRRHSVVVIDSLLYSENPE